MRTLNLSNGTFDYENKFRVAGVSGDVGLHKDYKVRGDGVLWGLQGGTVIKSSYSQQDREHRARMNSYEPIQQGEVVLIEGKQYKANILGNYSDCVIFEEA